MNKVIIGLLTSAALFIGSPLQAGSLDSAVQDTMVENGPWASVPVIIKFNDQLDIKALRREVSQLIKEKYPDKKKRKAKRKKLLRNKMVDGLRKKSKQAKQLIRSYMRLYGERTKLKSLWAINGIAGDIPVYLLDELAALPGVDSIVLDVRLQGPGTGEAPTAPVYWNLDATGASSLWQNGHTGTGVVIATLDTGVDITHPDLAPRWRGGSNGWLDPYGQHATPADANGHGTRVMGLIVAGDAGGYQIGMAPDAQWISAKIFDDSNEGTLSGIHEAFQWLLDPDGDSLTDDAPDIVNNSWALNGTLNQCNQEFTQDITLLKEAGIVVVYSGGNYGPGADTSVSPSNNPSVVSVGAVNSMLDIETQSSRGAGACDGGIYPHIVAPGAGVLTTDVMPAFYNFVDGTSFSVAHLAGGMALLKSAFPEASVSQLEAAVINSASDLGAPGPDDDYGYGLLNVAGAYAWLESETGIPSPGSLWLSSATYSGDENTPTVTLSVNRVGGSSGAVSVEYQTTDGTAIAGQDYQATSGILNYSDGEISRSFTVSLLDDSLFEADEAFTVSIGNPLGGATLGSVDSAVVTILDDDPQPQPGIIALAASADSIDEDGTRISVTVNRSGGSNGATTIDYATANGSALSGVDYAAVVGTLTFLDGQISKVITVDILDDSDYEGDESFTLALSNITGGATLGSPNTVTISILDNDLQAPADADGDGFAIADDCNDLDSSIYPGAPETKHDGIDQDCNGYDLTIDITSAVYKVSKDKLTVLATTDLGSAGALKMTVQHVDGSSLKKNLTWKSNRSRWQKSLKSYEQKWAIPETVTVYGPEGEVTLSVTVK